MSERSDADGTPARSVFGQHIDADLAERLAAVEVDDPSDLLPEVEAAAIGVLHLGISLLGANTTFERDESAPARAVHGRASSGLTATPVTSSLLLARDTKARRAFILGGPRGLTGGGAERD